MKRILLTGGGTGGHIYPLIAVAEALHDAAPIAEEAISLRYFGPHDAWSEKITQAGISRSRIASAKLRRYFSLNNFVDGPKFLLSILQGLVKVAIFKPHVAFSKGGPGALPILMACRLYGIPIVIHESDSVPGLVSRIAGRWARIIELGWETARIYFPGKKTRVVGVPLRAGIVRGISRSPSKAKQDLGLDPVLPCIFITGGSQGSERMNALVLASLPTLLEQYQVVHQTGEGGHAMHEDRWKSMKKEIPEMHAKRYHPRPYFEADMATAYAAADCVVTRAGSAIFEVAAYGKPAILIPLPEAANGHQNMNADLYAALGAGIVMKETDAPDTLMEKIAIALDGEINPVMAQAAKSLAKPHAAQAIARDIMHLLRE